jgi:hypothetical protein
MDHCRLQRLVVTFRLTKRDQLPLKNGQNGHSRSTHRRMPGPHHPPRELQAVCAGAICVVTPPTLDQSRRLARFVPLNCPFFRAFSSSAAAFSRDGDDVLAQVHPSGVVVRRGAVVESTLTRDESTSPRFAASANIPSSRASKTPASRHCRGALVLPTAPAAQPRTGHRSTPRTLRLYDHHLSAPLHGIAETLTRAEQGTTPPRSLACHEKHAPASRPGSPVTASRKHGGGAAAERTVPAANGVWNCGIGVLPGGLR